MIVNNRKMMLHHNVTALQKLNYKCENSSARIWMKRDDTLDFAFGGNKVRLFEYIIPEILKGKYEKIVTFGSIYSNHNRVTAAVAAYLGLNCDLIVLCDDISNKSVLCVGGNGILINNYYAANIICCSVNDAHNFIDDYQNQQKENGVNYFWIPGGGHMPIAVAAYEDAMKEIILQAAQMNVEFDAVYLPTGTGTTQAGVICGLKNYRCDIFGVTVARDKERCKNEIMMLLNQYDAENKLESRIHVLDNVKLKYGEKDDVLFKMAKHLAHTDGIVLDPIYNAKGFMGMLRHLENKQYRNVLYINTGGSPNIFSVNTQS